MTRLLDRRLGALGHALVLALLMASLGTGTGCKKAPQNDESKGSKMAPAKSMDAPSSTTGTTDGKKKTVAGMGSKVDSSNQNVTAGMTAPGPATNPPRPAAGPVKVQLVVGLNAVKLRKTFLWKKFLSIAPIKTVLSGKTFGQLKTGLGTDPLLIVDSARIVLGGKSLNEIRKPEHLALFFSGRFDASATIKKLLKIPIQAGSAQLVLTKINGKDVIRGKGKKGESFALVAVNRNTIAMCSDTMLHIVTKGDLTGGNAAIASQIKALDAKSLAWIVFGGVKVPLGNAGATPALAALKRIQGGSVVLDNGKTKWKMVNRLDVGTSQAANSLLQLVKMMKTTLARSGGRPGFAPALRAILKNLTVIAKNQIIIATVELVKADVKTILDSLLKKL